ncbi:hypothetical protein MTX26_35465 (plasmid) [Bradyrhizobium sp. ISRA443]|uniref:hypothetical protein n=1 Tax=unclassified Bradyrhizobium TaxID=2631580 RepID=UPI00247A00BB|nr:MULTISPECIES: hypothetical protein [unclassified Bradyrhizobium]WGR90730.1 hypothetical protein MTX20_01330 [Bradyrhizobium sp. ISRA435]WGS03139.1 hypothetical protein MTX23_35155 [Bradyrhizobium sp. ISRA436]WGS10067.1 hypothetical protein MTX18_35465 [Bradyrhizobium sp. ISRA437]WGS16952.1 hypothetical protein MTX26_35465 [Bradyrhizobium sp. ISRA443]
MAAATGLMCAKWPGVISGATLRNATTSSAARISNALFNWLDVDRSNPHTATSLRCDKVLGSQLLKRLAYRDVPRLNFRAT